VVPSNPTFLGTDERCVIPGVCGNGYIEDDEQCDDGDRNDDRGHCHIDCHLNQCGDGYLDRTEECDDGVNNGDTRKCRSDCIINRCGDGYINMDDAHHEGCDGGDPAKAGSPEATPVEKPDCNIDCTKSRCGDGKVNHAAGEECDDGTDSMGNNNNHAGARCKANCQLNVCGDSDTLNQVEQCDPGRDALGNRNTPTCDRDCTSPVCGDGLWNKEADEECDAGAANGMPDSPCDTRCKSIACGNGVVDVGEDCDDGVDGVRADSARCNSDCSFARCGDGKVNDQFKPDGMHPEVCDDRDTNGVPVNGVPCDYGNPFCRRCNRTCTGYVNPGGPFCGDTIPQSLQEDCDPGTGPSTSSPSDPRSPLAAADSATCNIDCTSVVCGDGHLNTLAHETCDDGNSDPCGTCPSTTETDCRGATPTTPTQATITVRPSGGDKINTSPDGKFTLNDGFGMMLTFEFTTGSTPSTGDVAIHFSQTDSSETIATEMAAAIPGKLGDGFSIDARVPAPPGDRSTVILTNTHRSSLGNTSIQVSGLPDFAFGDGTPEFTHGAAGDCKKDTGCVSDDDCASGVCDSATHKCRETSSRSP
jgi:hypothetical protein